MKLVDFLIINFGALLTALGGVFLKRLSESLNFNLHSDQVLSILFRLLSSIYLWLGAFCYLAPIILWAFLLKRIELTKLQPLLSIVYLYTAVLAFILLNEHPSFLRIFGIAVIMTGVFIVGKS